MAISDNQKLDYLFKKVGFGATKTDTVFNKLAANESLPSPLLIRGDTIWAESGSIPSVKPSASNSYVTLQTIAQDSYQLVQTEAVIQEHNTLHLHSVDKSLLTLISALLQTE